MADDQEPKRSRRGGFTRSLPLDVTPTMGDEIAAVADVLGVPNNAAGRLLIAAGLAVYRGGDAARLLAISADVLKAS